MQALGTAPPSQGSWRRVTSARALFRAGRISAALELLAEPGPQSGRLLPDEAEQRTAAIATRLDLELARGNLAEASVLGSDLAGTRSGLHPVALVARGELAAALDDPARAAAHFLAAGEAAPDDSVLPQLGELLAWRAGAAWALLHQQQAPAARVLAADHHREAVRHGVAFDIAQALRVRAATDPGDRRIMLLHEAREVLVGVPAARLQAQLDTDLAGLLTLSGTGDAVAQAVGLLRSAESYARLEELQPLGGRVRRLLGRLGETPLRLDSGQLSDAESRVVRLVLAGHSNREVAQRLNVSIKGVEWHLSRIYRKLGVGNRVELTVLLGA